MKRLTQTFGWNFCTSCNYLQLIWFWWHWPKTYTISVNTFWVIMFSPIPLTNFVLVPAPSIGNPGSYFLRMIMRYECLRQSPVYTAHVSQELSTFQTDFELFASKFVSRLHLQEVWTGLIINIIILFAITVQIKIQKNIPRDMRGTAKANT